MAAAIDAVEARGGSPVVLRTSQGALVGGPLSYDHLGGVTVDGPADHRSAGDL